MTTPFATSGCIGTRLTTTSTDAAFSLGERVTGTDGTIWVYVQASGAIDQYHAVSIDEDFQAASLTHANALAGHMVGFAQNAFTDDDYGWVALGGANISVMLAAACAKDVQLYTSGTAGVLDDTATSTASLIRGVVAAVSGTGTAVAREIIAQGVSATATP